MAEKSKGQDSGLLTLTEVSQRTKISMPTLQRYKKNYQNRIPSQGKGRSQRYPEEALQVFEEIKKENIGKRGRPKKAKSGSGRTDRSAAKSKKTGSRRGRKKATKASSAKASSAKTSAAQAKGGDEQLLTLTEIGKRTGISYPTLSRYVKKHSSKLKSEGTGRSRRFYPEAVEVFQEIRSKSKRGRRAGTKSKAASRGTAKAAKRATSSGSGGGGKVDRDLMKRLSAIEKQLSAIEKQLSKPMQVTLRR